MPKTLIPIFADQLTQSLSSLAAADRAESVILMMEVMGEATHVPHHRTKLVFLFSAMRHFAQRLRDAGWEVDYVYLDDPANTGDFTGEVKRAIARHTQASQKIEKIYVTEPSIYRVLETVKEWQAVLDRPVHIFRDDRFIATKDEFADWAHGRKELRLEYFYREMRRKTGLLMDGDKPVGGAWNFDKYNRKPPKKNMQIAPMLKFTPNLVTQDVIDMVAQRFDTRIGDIDTFFYAVTREDALRALEHFIDHRLADFGDYQDAMMVDEPFLFHSILSPYLNTGLLSAMEVCLAIEAAYAAGKAPINAVEGFIRQIIGWREYIRGIYWYKMPAYKSLNYLNATEDLPDFFWTGHTDMQCLSQTIQQTLQYAYAHHIQRLMITGNFALLAGVDPYAVHEWYLSVYLDAFEWVELPNTLGMSQFGDGGLLGSKPYTSSGAYINRMSNYCKSCRYDVKQKIGDKACPFNALYWHFLDRHQDKLKDNMRLSMPYRNLEKMDVQYRSALMQTAERFLDTLSRSKTKEYL